MKKLSALILITFATSFVFSQSKVYYPFPERNAYWREGSGGYQCSSCCREYQYIISGDTLFNNTSYQVISQSGKIYYSTPAGDCVFSQGYGFFQDFGLLRNDSVGKKVYFIEHGESTEQLLYDFNLELNDTIPPSFINRYSLGGDIITVASVDSVLVNGDYHKSFGIATSSSPGSIYAYLIEGVGSTFGLFGSMGSLWPPFEFGSFLYCLSVNGQTVYPENAVECILATGLDKPFETVGFAVYPNPMHETATIIVPDNIQFVDFSIIDLSGKEVYSIKNVRFNSLISAHTLKPGIYFYHFSVKGSIVSSGKLIVN